MSKRMRKAVLAGLLVLAMMLCLCSCGSSQGSGGFNGGGAPSSETVDKFNEFANRIKEGESGTGSSDSGSDDSQTEESWGSEGLEEEVSLIGTWSGLQYYSQSRAKEILEALQFYEDEITYADLSYFPFWDTLTFNEDGTYSFGVDEATTKEMYRSYLDNFFTAIFNNRDKVSEYVNIQNSTTVEEFKTTYATKIFSYANYDELLDAMVEHVNDNYTPGSEEGTYYTEQEYIYMMANGASEYDAVESGISGRELRLTYSYDDGSTSTVYYYK